MESKARQVSKELLSKIPDQKDFGGVDETNLETLAREGPFAYTDRFIAHGFYNRQVERISEMMKRYHAGEVDLVPEIWMICKGMVLPSDPYIPKSSLLQALVLNRDEDEELFHPDSLQIIRSAGPGPKKQKMGVQRDYRTES